MIYNLLPDVPDPPSNVHLTSPCHTRITELHWHSISDNHPPVSHFIIQYNTSFNPEVWSTAKKLSTGDRHYDRISLSPWGNYSFRVIARNSVGDSLPSEPSAQPCSTPPDVPHHNPSGICTKNAKPHQLVITWKAMPPEQQNAPGFYYLVKWRRHDTVVAPSFEERILDADQDELIISEQPIYKPYEIYVLAVNEVGEAVAPPKMTIGYSGEDGEFL
ncbi:hypothetical protein CAPTEDRAFT_147499 [Capitella teleta]|uniref:Fibronectin type-III domain-containing protein n=1 Tax=Capitella teleta TaxID=283909 RepID=R7TZM9_CAPTE|nr:hypothetical protein CAPTEDRAFT_147499 [Capitella teleta]|eukprot:ELT96380.1 hypothetical protein CAPTEDRAFT_147499 [Capitella teleta]